MGSGCRCESGDSLFHPKVRWGEDSILNASAGVSRKSGPAGGVEGVHGLHQADGADGDQIVLLTGESVVFFCDVGHEAQVMTDELFPGGQVALPQSGKGLDLLLRAERAGKAAAFQMKRKKQKLCGKKLQKR